MSTQTVAQRKALYGPPLTLLSEITPTLDSKVEAAALAERELGLVKSVASSLYIELDKLSKKSPTHELSDLALSQVNQVISDARTLLAGDAYIDRIKEFVPAGDNPEHRDAVLVLGQVLAGIERGAAKLSSKTHAERRIRDEAKALNDLLVEFFEGSTDNSTEWYALEAANKKWFRDNSFIVADLETRIRERFAVEP